MLKFIVGDNILCKNFDVGTVVFIDRCKNTGVVEVYNEDGDMYMFEFDLSTGKSVDKDIKQEVMMVLDDDAEEAYRTELEAWNVLIGDGLCEEDLI